MPAGGLAARVMGWQRRLGAVPGPLGASGEAGTGQPVTVEVWIGGAWVDITATSSVMVRDDSGSISITSGIRDEGSQTEYATCSLELKNSDGRFSPRNPTGIYYGMIGRNTPVRVSVPDGLGGKSYRLRGEISEWAANWDTSGSDVWTDVSASGILRRLAQAPAPERSVIYNAITNPLPTSVVAYWPCEDAPGATSLKSALAAGAPMTWTGTPTLASYTGLAATDPLPDLTTATLSGRVPDYADPTATQVRFLASIPAAGLALGKVLVAIDQQDYSAGASQFWEVYYDTSSNSLTIRTCASDGTVLGVELPHTLDVRGRLLYVSVELQEAGANITRTLRLKDVNTSQVTTVSDTVFNTQLTQVIRVQFGPASRAVSGTGTANLPGVAIGHVTVENAITAIDALGPRLNPIGETAGRRIQRLCGEQGLAFGWIGDLDDTTPLGAQGKSNLLTLAQEACLADGGLLYESRSALGLGYRTRASLYNQDPVLTLDYTAAQLAQIPTPVEDDRYIQNKVTVTCGDASATYEETSGTLGTALPPAGVGSYGQDVTLNLATSDTATLRNQAAWRVHLGTVDEPRFPQISVNLAHPAITPDMRRAILGIRIGDRIQITNPPVWLPPDTIDQLVLGTSETITHFEHRLTFNCQPASPYSAIGYLDGPTARVDTDGSALAEPVTSTGTLLDVTATSGPIWTSASTDFPFTIRVGGEVMTVTSISPQPYDRFDRSSASGWGTTTSGHTWTETGGATADRTVTGTAGVINLGATPTTIRFDTTGTPTADTQILVSISPGQVSTGNSLAPGVVMRWQDSSTFYRVRLLFRQASDGQTVGLNATNGSTDLGTYETGQTYVANDVWWVRAKTEGQTISARAWKDGSPEPTAWQLVTTVTSGTITSGTVGISASGVPGITNVNPTITYDNVTVSGPQTFTVTRSVNGVIKAHVAGEDVRLANPTIIAL
ncbi:hypothetical protein [Streptomyces sp. NPDC059597]|uniref:hypothetical protein n=1 Tax=Streptomyces sp. NPDC059597 TaxID=3346879 RepID=UPI00367A3164